MRRAMSQAGPSEPRERHLVQYVGSELEVFQHASNWKKYWARQVQPYLCGDVLEVGAGIGGTTRFMPVETSTRWVCLEPDERLAEVITDQIRVGTLPSHCEVRIGTTEDIALHERFDAIIYADVLEHIEDDRAEVKRAVGLLREGGFLLILGPAHQWLYSPFDRAVGHFRRYNRSSLMHTMPSNCPCLEVRYLDSVGLLLSAGNRWLLRSNHPSARQILYWDRMFVPISTLLDPLLRYRVGKSILAICRKTS